MKKTTKSSLSLLLWISSLFLWAFLLYLLYTIPSCTKNQPNGSQDQVSLDTVDVYSDVDSVILYIPLTFEESTWVYFNFKIGKYEYRETVEIWRDYIPQEPQLLQLYDTLVRNGKSHPEAARLVFELLGENKRKPI